MHIISRKRLNEFVEKYPKAKVPLARWYRLIKATDFTDFRNLRLTLSSADQVGKYTVFNIGGNNVRWGMPIALDPEVKEYFNPYLETGKA